MTDPILTHWTDGERLAFQKRGGVPAHEWVPDHWRVRSGSDMVPFSPAKVPHADFPLRLWSMPSVREIILCWGPQSGKTQVALSLLGYAAANDPGPALYVMPDERVARRFMSRQLGPTIRKNPALSHLITDRRADNTRYLIQLRNGMDIALAWATSAAELASESWRYVFADEPGKYGEFVGAEADPFSLIDVRQTAYPYTSKRLYFSTPAESGDIFDRLMTGRPDVTYHKTAICPICRHEQRMTSEGLHGPEGTAPKTILRRKLGRYLCSGCGMAWDDAARNAAVSAGRWLPDVEIERPRSVLLHLPRWYSPIVSLSESVAARAEAREDLGKKIAYVTQHKAESFRPTVTKTEESAVLAHVRDYPAGLVPPEAVALTAGVDMQRLGFWYVVRAWAPDLTSWLVQYGALDSWKAVEDLIFRSTWQRMGSETRVPIWRAALDTGGGLALGEEHSRTEEAYQWLRKVAPYGRIYGVKGGSVRRVSRVHLTQIDRYPGTSKPIPGGLALRILDVDQFKDVIHFRLSKKDGESQGYWLYAGTGVDYAQQLLAEEKRRDRRTKRLQWVQVRDANHLLDCEVYAASCADPEWTPSLQAMAAMMIQNQAADVAPSRPAKQEPEAPRSGAMW